MWKLGKTSREDEEMAKAAVSGYISSTPISLYVCVKEFWTDEWVFVPWLTVSKLNWCVAPKVAEATFEYNYGMIMRPDMTARDYFPPLNVDGMFIGVFGAYWDVIDIPIWFGVIDTNGLTMFGSVGIASGTQEIKAYGLEHILDRVYIRRSSTEGGLIDRPLTFNKVEGPGMQPVGNRSQYVDGDGLSYFNAADGYIWTRLDIVQYLLGHTDLGSFTNDEALGVTFDLSGDYEALVHIADEHKLHGESVKEALDTLIARKRGLGWRIWTNGAGVVCVDVFSYIDAAYSVGGIEVPANSDQWYVFWDGDPYPKPTVIRDDASRFDAIDVWGGPVYSTFTLSFVDGTLGAGWTVDLQAAYVAPGGADWEAEDANRLALAYRDVFSYFRAVDEWNWYAGDGDGGTPQNAAPGVTSLGAVRPEIVPNVYWQEHEFERHLPFRIGDSEDFAKPFALIADPDTSTYIFVDKTTLIDRQGIHLRLADGALGFRLISDINHRLGLNMGAPESTNFDPEFDYTTLIFTGMAQTDVNLKVHLEGPCAGRGAHYKAMTIECPEYIAQYVTPGTVVDVVDGALVYYGDVGWEAAENNLERDDSLYLLAIGLFALAHYCIQRLAVTLEIQELTLAHPAGSMICAAVGAGYAMPIATVVTDRTWDCKHSQTTVATEHVELDFAKMY